ncbi:hypothetical protein [Pararhizobium sp.]|uniref:hypothetical protein n=1 Tax=Pararhizobium sp. TaxID=1977563 RepID=UPI002718226E|nr:hypothetical protein [Pararhizobium sp.]MDO9415993.1 hypothetical protein [Pararhizobium sp.]
MKNIDTKTTELDGAKRVWLVSDFCRRYRLDEAERKRLESLLGQFASGQELLMNSNRSPVFR